MLAKRICPTILVKGRIAVKGEKYDSWRNIGLAMEKTMVHARRGVDELIVLDVAATAEGRTPDLDMVRELTAGCFIPVTVGGGVRSLKDIDALLRAGADKVAIGTAAVEVPTLIREASEHFGRQAIVVSLDVRRGESIWVRSGNKVCGKVKGSHVLTPGEWAKGYADEGAGEILLSSIDRDGTMQGYDLPLIREVSQAVDVPVIASGGCSGYEDMLNAFRAGADACAAGALFAFSDATPRGAAQFLKKNGLEVRC
jgi:cyclase